MNLTKTQKAITIALAGISIFAAAAYLQYKRMMDYVITFKAVRLRKIQANLIDFDLYLNFKNNADVAFTIESQVYDVYLNNNFVSKVVNNAPVPILKKATSIIPLKVQVNPEAILKKVLKNPLELIANYDKIKLKVVIKMRVKLWFFKVNIPYTYEATLKELMAPQPQA